MPRIHMKFTADAEARAARLRPVEQVDRLLPGKNQSFVV